METKTEKKERRILDFNGKQFELELQALHNMARTAKIFQEAWEAQPILKNTTFELRHLQGCISDGADYLRQQIVKLIAAKQDAQLEGLSQQMQPAEVKLINVDEGKLDRTGRSLTSKHPADKHFWANSRMLRVEAGEICIPSDVIDKLRENMTVYADASPELAKIHEIGTLTASSASMLMNIMRERKEAKEKLLGYKLPDQHIELFKTKKPGITNQRPGPLSYQDGKIIFNISHFI